MKVFDTFMPLVLGTWKHPFLHHKHTATQETTNHTHITHPLTHTHTPESQSLAVNFLFYGAAFG